MDYCDNCGEKVSLTTKAMLRGEDGTEQAILYVCDKCEDRIDCSYNNALVTVTKHKVA